MLYVPPIGGAANDPYVDGNPGAGTEGSAVPAAAIENPQREILAVITGVGLAPNAGDLTQLRQAIAKMIQAGQRAVILNNCTFAGAVTGAGKVVYWDSTNNRFDLALADGSAKQAAVGFADVPNGNVYCFGDAVLFAGLTPGSRYYLDNAIPGAVTSALPASNAVFVGIAKNATEVFVDIDAQSSAPSSGLQGAFRNLTGSATGLNGLATYAVDELTTGDGTGNFQTLRNWAGSINVSTLGVGGLDVGAVAASTWYYAYGISKADGSKAFIASLASTGPSFVNAAGYTKWARIGAFRTDASGNKFPLAFKQSGRKVFYTVAAGSNVPASRIMASGLAGSVGTPTWVAVAIGAYVPPTAGVIKVLGFCSVASMILIAAPNNSYGPATSSTNPPPIYSGDGSGASNAVADMPIESANIYYATNSTGGVACLGWEDNL